MIGKGINDGDTLIFEKTNVLESANPKYDPIIIDVTNECFRIIGKLVCKFSGVE